MCGICGMYSFSRPLENVLPAVEQALETLTKRGPEIQAHYQERNVVLGHTRLSIIDTTDAANQPFTDESGRYTIVFNGEIYNFAQLREVLRDQGLTFRTRSDTEVLLKWLMVKGPEGIQDLQGFFAFAFFDKLTGKILIANDRFGKKPLLYHINDDRIIFASEMKALLKLGAPKVLDHESMHIYFQLNYIPGKWSIYQDVYKLMPGHYLLFEGSNCSVNEYYHLPDRPLPNYDGISYSAAIAQLQKKMEEAVVKRLVSDVPLGAFLSGGIDSSVVVALAAKHVKQLKTFSIGFKDEPMFDETLYARSVAKMHGTDHTEFSLTTQDLLGCLYDVLDYIDEPFADSSALAVYILSRETKSKVTVALSGDGADEMFAGYNKHMAHFRARQGGLSARLLGGMYPLLAPFPQSRNSVLGNKIRQLYRFGEGMGMNDADRYWRWAAFAGESYPEELLLKPANKDEYVFRKGKLTQYLHKDGNLNNILRNDMHLVLTNDMLTKVDLMSMANSLEVRVPFLDHDVVDFVFSLPENYKIDQNQRKKILKDAFRQMLPPELYHRPKQGFEVPLLGWFRSELKEKIVNHWLSDDFIREQGLFNPKVINNLKKKLFSSNPGEIHAQMWSLVVFQQWYINFHSHK